MAMAGMVSVSAMGQAPANDLCTAITAEPLVIGGMLMFDGDNTNATFAGDAEPGTVLADYPSPNTWHAFTTSTCADVTVSYCTTDSGWSNVWKLLSTDCPAQTFIYPGSSTTTTCSNGNWTFTFTSLAAGTYYLPVPHVGFGQGGGPYSIAVTAVACTNGAPANDLCSAITPQPLSPGASLTFTGDNTFATFAGDAESGTLLADYPSPNTWHAFTTTECTNVTVDFCATDSGWSNVWKLLTTECPAQTIIYPNSSNTTDCGNGNWTFTFTDLAAGTYYLPVPNVGFGQGGGTYSIAVSAFGCANVAPSNDLCTAVTPQSLIIGASLTFNGDNSFATFAGDAEPGTLLADYPSPNTWHAFTTTECTNLTVSYCATDSGWSNVWKLLASQCPAQTLVIPTLSDTTSCANGNWTFFFMDLAAGTYYLPVPNVGFGQGGGPYTVQVSAASCVSMVPDNDLCSAITAEPLVAGTPLTFNGDNTYATFAGDAEAGTVLADYPSPNTWHAFTTTECTDITVNYCATDSGWSNVWKLVTTDCPAQTLINATTSDTNSCSNDNWTFTFDNLEAGTYYLPVPNVGFGQGGGPYSITLEAVNCLITSINDADTSGDWNVYPNPATGPTVLVLENMGSTGMVELLDMTGRVLQAQQIGASGSAKVELALNGDLAAGQYILRFISASGNQAKRLVLH